MPYGDHGGWDSFRRTPATSKYIILDQNTFRVKYSPELGSPVLFSVFLAGESK